MTQSTSMQNYLKIRDKFPAYHALFAAEIDKTDYLILSGSKISVISPTGLIISKIWFTGTLISYDSGKSGEFIRIADPTGGISFYIHPKYQDYYPPQEDLVPPLFLSVTGSFERDNNFHHPFRIVLETCNIIDRKRRDFWIATAAADLSNRLNMLEHVISYGDQEKQNDAISEAIIHYRTDRSLICNLGKISLIALNAIQPAENICKDPRDIILEIIEEHSGSKGINIDELTRYSRRHGIGEDLLKDTLRNLISDDEVYQPAPGQIKLL